MPLLYLVAYIKIRNIDRIVKWSRYLLVSAIVFYVLYDIVSTLAAYNFLGSFEYEKSFLIKAAYDVAGVPGFITLKIVMSAAAISAAYLLMEHYTRLRAFGAGILGGATVAGFFVGTSNFNILLNGSSIWILGLDSGTIAAIIIVVSAGAGLLMSRPEPARVAR
ncbi:hypothetical protein LRC155 [Methanocella arvoryzae MRE50]|uniref:DUF5658 domain-containing protein n=1 Tax=Methanocella arvoryzae (strain DSM 22066 / NBRC 105507 / MRE50) TaxID=351160 RepID=Q0W953_METAR|nr:hypothetical protein LRC155 [Methanocella arvoryzae MRE50]